MLKFDISELSGSCGIWINGPLHCGKDYAVRTLDLLYVNSINKWYDGYKNEKCVLISDVETSHSSWLRYFKIWADRYPFTAEIKGSSMIIRPKFIFVPSNFEFRKVIPDSLVDAIEARFKCYQFDCATGYKVWHRNKHPVTDRVLHV